MSGNVLDQWDNPHARADQLRELRVAVDDWQRWAGGKPIPLDRVATIAATLRTADHFAGAQPLANVVEQWASMNRLEIPQLQLPRTGPHSSWGCSQ